MEHAKSFPGLNFRLRHLLIIVLYFGVVLGLFVPVLRFYDASRLVNSSLLILISSPWILGILVLVVERKGPVKYWAAPLLLSLTSPALALCHDWGVLFQWRATGAVPSAIATLAINIALIGSFTFFWVMMRPVVCPQCSRRTMIPLLRFTGRAKRTPRTYWCASCSAKFWWSREGSWKAERRKTWIDGPAAPNHACSTPGTTIDKAHTHAAPHPSSGRPTTAEKNRVD